MLGYSRVRELGWPSTTTSNKANMHVKHFACGACPLRSAVHIVCELVRFANYPALECFLLYILLMFFGHKDDIFVSVMQPTIFSFF
jgi:hypothetical protein